MKRLERALKLKNPAQHPQGTKPQGNQAVPVLKVRSKSCAQRAPRTLKAWTAWFILAYDSIRNHKSHLIPVLHLLQELAKLEGIAIAVAKRLHFNFTGDFYHIADETGVLFG